MRLVERHGDTTADTRRRFTLHVEFAADDVSEARTTAAALAQGLGRLRPEVDAGSALLSPAGWIGCAVSVVDPAPDAAVLASADSDGRLSIPSRSRAGSVDDEMAHKGAAEDSLVAAGVTGHWLGGRGRRADLPYSDYER
jgi:hypothetical protein